LFAASLSDDAIYEFTPDGTRSTFASGLNVPDALAFNSSGNLYVADYASGHIFEFTLGGTQSAFASGLGPMSLAFDPMVAPEPPTWALLGLGAAGLLMFRRRK
jgi:DNA-binding beta-propeller fold protein YncE